MLKKLRNFLFGGALVAASMLPLKSANAGVIYDFVDPTGQVISYNVGNMIANGKQILKSISLENYSSGVYKYTENGKTLDLNIDIKFDSNGNVIFDDDLYLQFIIEYYTKKGYYTSMSSHFVNNYTESDIDYLFNESLSSSDNYLVFMGALKDRFNHATVVEKKKALNRIYSILYESYDQKVATGHFYNISQEAYFQELKLQNKVGNCGDISCVMLDIGKDVFGVTGLVVSMGVHMLPIFKFPEGDLYSPERDITKKSFFEIMESFSYTSITNIISNCDDGLIAEVQSFIQRQYQKTIMPGNITNIRDFGNLKHFEFGLSDTELFFLGNSNKDIYGFKKSYINDFKSLGFEKVSGNFGVTGYFNVQSAKDGRDKKNVIGVSGYTNLSKNFTPSMMKDLDIVCGNFTKGIVEGDVFKGLGIDTGAAVTIDVSSELYCLFKTKKNLVVSSSFGIKPYFTTPSNQYLKTYKFYEFGASYQVEGYKFEISQKKIGLHKENIFSAAYNFKDWKVDGSVIYNQYGDDIARSILPKLQKKLTLTYADLASLSVINEGSESKIMFNLKIPFEFWKKF
ncbi:MAG: hypothetical protein HRU03_01170 [Nanoarchaeales archaeon]|nr:hypothetical protein [Nanoarchaeales archaeon]